MERRSFRRERSGREEFAEITWTRRAAEFVEGPLGTPGTSRDLILKSESEVGQAVQREAGRLLAAGFVELAGGPPLRADPVEHTAKEVEQHHAGRSAVPVFMRGDGEVGGTRRGGLPFLPAGEPWPTCASCQRCMRFVVQIALAELEAISLPVPPRGLLQLFVCDTDCYSSGGWQPFSGVNLVRIVASAPGGLADAPTEVPGSDADFLLPPSRLQNWKIVPDAPGPESIAELASVDFDTAIEAWELLKEQGLCQSEKVGGWPQWVQDEEVVTCKACGTPPMRFVMQLSSMLDGLDFYDSNVLYVLGCASCTTLASVQQR